MSAMKTGAGSQSVAEIAPTLLLWCKQCWCRQWLAGARQAVLGGSTALEQLPDAPLKTLLLGEQESLTENAS